jgi:hypothetical protein
MCKNTNNCPNRKLVTNPLFSFPRKYRKQNIHRNICFSCCYASEYNMYYINNSNINFSTCKNKRLNALKYNDPLSTGGNCTGYVK